MAPPQRQVRSRPAVRDSDLDRGGHGSTDHTSQVLREKCSNATVVLLAENTGCAVGSNIGAAAPHDLLFFLDDDSELAPDAVPRAAQVLLADNRGGAVTGAIIESGKPVRVIDTPSPVFIIPCHSQGASRKRAFLAAGMYPNDFFYGTKEMALSLRLLEAGYDIVFRHNPNMDAERTWGTRYRLHTNRHGIRADHDEATSRRSKHES